jgi:hypothetical protein
MIKIIALFLLILIYILIRKINKVERFNSNSNLEFIHIPKNAGTSIEKAGKKVGIKWGFKQWTKHGVNNDRSNLFKIPGNWINSKYNIQHVSKNRINTGCFPWHEIPDNMPEKIFGENVKTFCVVRDPYTKIVSAYKYWRGKDANPDDLNNFIRERLTGAGRNPEKLWWNSGHILPQNLYTHGHRKCDYIIRFENLDREFNDLMKKFNINGIELDKYNKSSKQVCVNDLNLESRNLIQSAYKKDFELFNYSM